MPAPIRVTVWNEYRHERSDRAIAAVYPQGIHEAIAGFLRTQDGLQVRTATLDEPACGLAPSVLEQTDVLTWWGHQAHGEVADDVVNRVYARVQDGMGLICLHSAHFSRIFKKLMGTDCRLRWREAGERERVWVMEPGHPIAQGLSETFEIPHSEMYGERFEIPAPDTLVFMSWFQGGEVFRSGCCFHRGRGKLFYFSPGHETYPIYHHPDVLRVIGNAVRWAAPSGLAQALTTGNTSPLERLG
ncbi:MAG: ThuA domain-containing protein [Actinobacteria bacterium]|nr:ThuA domain-containing protein [Actinomycetota bacterium]